MKKCVVFDLDGTLCELKPELERNNHIGNEKPIISMCNFFHSIMGIEKIILTGRKYTYRDITRQWIDKNIGTSISIIMQEKHTADKNHIFKKEQLQELQKKYEILALVDDNPDMIPVCKELGINILYKN